MTQEIDRQLEAAGWLLQDLYEVNPSAGLGVAVREFPLQTGHADYMLYVAGKVARASSRSGRPVLLRGRDGQRSSYSGPNGQTYPRRER